MSEMQTFSSGETPTFSVRILDIRGNPVQPIAGAVGRFAIMQMPRNISGIGTGFIWRWAGMRQSITFAIASPRRP
jgi:hypothetical protein